MLWSYASCICRQVLKCMISTLALNLLIFGENETEWWWCSSLYICLNAIKQPRACVHTHTQSEHTLFPKMFKIYQDECRIQSTVEQQLVTRLQKTQISLKIARSRQRINIKQINQIWFRKGSKIQIFFSSCRPSRNLDAVVIFFTRGSCPQSTHINPPAHCT